MRTLLLTLFAASSAMFAQFSGLSSSPDGSQVYFTTNLRLKNSDQPLNGKAFAASNSAVRLFRARERVTAPPPMCQTSGFGDYYAAETGSAGAVALLYRAASTGGCSYPVNPLRTEITGAPRAYDLPGIIRLSASGRYALSFAAATGRPWDAVDIAFIDLATGARTPVSIPSPTFPAYFEAPSQTSGRVIANDGTAILAVNDANAHYRGYIIKPGQDPRPFPVSGARPLAISDDAARILYLADGIFLLDLASGASSQLFPAGAAAWSFSLDSAGSTALFLSGRQLYINGVPLASIPEAVTEATLSRDGSTVFAVTAQNGLLCIEAASGTTTELIGRTPFFAPSSSPLYASNGLAPTVGGGALSDSTIDGAPPFQPWLGDATMWIGEQKVPLLTLAPDHLRFLVPWSLNPGSYRVLAEIPGEHTPFSYPELEAVITAATFPQAGAVARQDWTQTYSGPVNTGEIIHIWALNLGPVSPEIAAGAAAPSSEPLSRITQPFTCSNAEVLYAGLAPGAVERIYQIDLRIGPVPGYQKFTCTLAGGEPFTFLTLNVVSPPAS